MINFKNEKQINEWIVNLENHLTILKANIECEKRQCNIVENNTDCFIYKENIVKAAESIRSCASMISGYIKK